jgi:GcrA cell cycle regulator
MYSKDSEWPQEDIDRLIAAWKAGDTVAMIENALGRSRNAVCGKVGRLCAKGVLVGRPNPSKRRPVDASQAPKKQRHRDRVPLLPSMSRPVQVVQSASNPCALLAPDESGAPPVAAIGQEAPAETVESNSTAFDATANGALVALGVPRMEFLPRKKTACCWPKWGNRQAPTHEYCNDRAIDGRPYCPAHANVAFYRVRDRQEAAA